MNYIFVIFVGLVVANSHGYKIISKKPTLFGDSPHWCHKRQSLYYVDFFGQKYNLLRYDYEEDTIYTAKIRPERQYVAFIIPVAGYDDLFAIGSKNRTVEIIKWNGESKYAYVEGTLFDLEQSRNFRHNIWHLAKADSKGRFNGGTMRMKLCSYTTDPYGSFYQYTPNNGVSAQFDGIGISNGIAWSKKKMYHIDACSFAMKSFDWDSDTGKIRNGREIFQIFKGDGTPTYTGLGLTIDTHDNLYMGMYNGSAVWKVDPRTAEILHIYKLPTSYVLNVAFGGPNMDELFVTSGQIPFDLFTGKNIDEEVSSTAGSLFIIRPGAKGYSGKTLRID